MSNATNVTYNVVADNIQVTPKLIFSGDSASKVNPTLAVVSSSSNVKIEDQYDNKSYTTTINFSGIKSSLSVYSYDIGLDSNSFSILNPLLNFNTLKTGDSIGVLNIKSIPAQSYNINSLPIIAINGFAVLPFSDWWSLLTFDSTISSDDQEQIKNAVKAIYPPMISLSSKSPLASIVQQIQSDIQSGIVSMSDVIDRLSSLKIGSNFIDPSKILFSHTNSTLPLGKPTHTYSISNWTACFGAVTSYNPINSIVNAFQLVDSIDIYYENQVLFSGNWLKGNNIATLTQPTTTAAISDLASTFGNNYTFKFPDGVTTLGTYVSMWYSAARASWDYISKATFTPTQVNASSTGYSLFTPMWWNGFKVGTEYQIPGDGKFASSDNQMTPFIVPFTSTNPNNIADLITNFLQADNLPTSPTTYYGQRLAVILLLQNDTWESVEWNYVGDNYAFAQAYFSNPSSATYDNLSSQLDALGYGLSNGSITSSTDDSIAFDYSITPYELSQFFSVTSIYSHYVDYTIHNYTIDNLSSLKEVVSMIDDPFEAIADKILTLRDEFNAKILSDVNCKVMNFPTIQSAVENYSQCMTYFQSLGNGTVPTTVMVYTALTPIFIGAINLGLYYSLIQDLYEEWPYSSIPSNVLICWENINNTYSLNLDFPWSPSELSSLVNWFFILPSPTSLKPVSSSVKTYRLSDQCHIFTTSTKPVTRYTPDHVLTLYATDAVQLDPSVNEIKMTMDALEDIATCVMAASTGYTVAKSSESMLTSILKNSNLSSLEDMATSNDPNVKSLYEKFSNWWVQTFHSKSNSVSSQYDHYKSIFFLPKAEAHQKHLSSHMRNLHSIFDAVSLSTFKNSDILGQVSQLSSNAFTKHHDLLLSTMGKLGTDVLAEDSIKLLDHAVEDVVHDSVDIAVDVGKVILNMTADILATAADLLSPVSVVTQLYNDLNEHIYNGFSQIPDYNSELFNGSATPGTPWSFSLATIPNMFSYNKGSYSSNWNSVTSTDGIFFLQGGLVGPNYKWLNPATVSTVNATDSVLIPYKLWSWGWSADGANSIPLISVRYDKMDLNKPVRFTFHTSVGDAFIYLMNGISYDSENQNFTNANQLTDIIVAPEPVKNHLGIIDPLRTFKKMVEVIYQLPRLFGCSGLFDYQWYKDLWTNFITDVGSQAWANDNQHISTNEVLAADSAGMGMALGYTAYAAAEGASFQWSQMIENGIVAVTDTTEVGLYTNKVDQINSEPNILSSDNVVKVEQFLSVVMHFIFDWKYAMNGGLLSYLKAHQGEFSYQLYDSYQAYCSETLSENEKNRRLTQLLNDYYYGSPTDMKWISARKPWAVATIPDMGDLVYDTQYLGVVIDLNSAYRWTEEQIANVQLDSSGALNLMTPVYSPSIFRDFMSVAAGLGRIAAGAFLEKRVARLFMSHISTAKKLAIIRSKIKKVTARPRKMASWMKTVALNKYHREHNSKARAKLINAQTTKLESTLTTQTNTLAGDISGIDTGMTGLTFGFH